MKEVDAAVVDRLTAYNWPGNVRELKNVIERAVIMSDEVVTVRDLPPLLDSPAVKTAAFDTDSYVGCSLRDFKEAMEKEFIVSHLERNDWNISRTATQLGIERTNLHKKIKAFDLQRGRKASAQQD